MTTKTIINGQDQDRIVSIPWEHEKIHSGVFFSYGEATDLGNGAIRNLLIKSPDSTEIHLYYSVYGEVETDVLFYAEPTVSDVGTEVTPMNRKREITTIPVTKLYHTPTIAGGAEGTLLEHKHMGSGRISGGADRTTQEWILKPGKYYLLRVTNATANSNYIAVEIQWYKMNES